MDLPKEQLASAGAIAANVLSWIARLCAIALCALTVLLCFPGLVMRLGIYNLVLDITGILPGVIAGYGLIPSPMGGVFRFDFAIAAAVLFVIDYGLQRVSHALR